MTREEDRELLSNLIFANKKFAENLEELKKLDGIAKKAEVINDIDEKIISQLEKVNMIRISHEITKSLKEELEKQRSQIAQSATAAEDAAKDLSKKAENLTVVADGFNNLDNMSQDLDEFVKKFKKMSSKSLFLGITVATVVGIFAGGVLSYAYQFGTGDTSRWLDFSGKTNAMVMPIDGGAYTISLPAQKFQFTLNQDQNGADVLAIYPVQTDKRGGKK